MHSQKYLKMSSKIHFQFAIITKIGIEVTTIYKSYNSLRGLKNIKQISAKRDNFALLASGKNKFKFQKIKVSVKILKKLGKHYFSVFYEVVK